VRLSFRSSLAAAAAVAVLAYGGAGHALPDVNSHEGMAGSTLGLCLLLVTALGLTALPRPERPARTIRALALIMPVAVHAVARLDARARASPSALQRFRN
jgi:hypothetical protein